MNEIKNEDQKSAEEKQEEYGKAGGYFMLYKNETEDHIRQFSVDLEELNKQAISAGLTKEQYGCIIYGFESAVRVIFGHYNLSPKQTPVDAMEESQKFVALMEKALEEEERKQSKSEG